MAAVTVVDAGSAVTAGPPWPQCNSDYDDFYRFLTGVCKDALHGELKKSTKEGAQLSKMDAQKQKMFDAIHHPKLLFKQMEFEKAMKNGFLNMGIVYNSLQITQKN